MRPGTQASVAISGDGDSWFIVGASPDLRQQILQTPTLWPRHPRRDSPIAGVILIGGDIDAIAGLLVMRERHHFAVYAPPPMLDLLAGNDVFNVLDASLVRRVPVTPREPVALTGGLTLTLLPMPGKTPLYRESPGAREPEAGPTYAAMLQVAGRTLIVAPACADLNDSVREQLRQADVLFFDGTLFTEDEMIAAGLGQKTSHRMGHVPLSGPNGSLQRLAGLSGRRIFLHINNTNPILLSDSPERRHVEQAGFEVAFDGMEIML